MSKSPLTSVQLSGQRTMMAARRTIVAAERTLMAWIRTALSMMSFGIMIYKVLEGVGEATHLREGTSPRTVGLFLIGLGTGSMILGVFEYWRTYWELHTLRTFKLWRSSFIIWNHHGRLRDGLILFHHVPVVLIRNPVRAAGPWKGYRPSGFEDS